MGTFWFISLLVAGLSVSGCGDDSDDAIIADGSGHPAHDFVGESEPVGSSAIDSEPAAAGEPSSEEQSSRAQAVLAVLTPACGVCHNATYPTLSTFETWHQLDSRQSNMPMVAAGDHQNSYLYHKLAGTHDEAPANGYGLPMPTGAAPFSATEMALVAAWIDGL